MKITNQPLPDDQPTAYRALISSNYNAEFGATIARTRRQARNPMHPRRMRSPGYKLADAAEAAATRMRYVPGSPAHARAVTRITEEILEGVFHDDAWQQLTPVYDAVLSNSPSSFNDDGYNPYLYIDPLNLPTIPTYNYGTSATGQLRYTGATTSGRFRDTLLVWRRMEFALPSPITKTQQPFVVLSYRPTLTVAASTRASRMMYQLLLPHLYGGAGEQIYYRADPPVWYMRMTPSPWRPPITDPPYYHDTQVLQATMILHPPYELFAWTHYSTLGLWIAPEPMRGRAFNNNTSVATSLSGEPAVYQLRL